MGMATKKRKALREKLYHEQNGLCYWCQEKTVLYEFKSDVSIIPEGLKVATLDHLYQKGNPLRYQNGIQRHVMACYDCNFERSKLQNGYDDFVGNPAEERKSR